jgi:hypothetical protein
VLWKRDVRNPWGWLLRSWRAAGRNSTEMSDAQMSLQQKPYQTVLLFSGRHVFNYSTTMIIKIEDPHNALCRHSHFALMLAEHAGTSGNGNASSAMAVVAIAAGDDTPSGDTPQPSAPC